MCYVKYTVKIPFYEFFLYRISCKIFLEQEKKKLWREQRSKIQQTRKTNKQTQVVISNLTMS